MVLFCLHSLLPPPSITPTSAYYLWDFHALLISFSSALLFYSLPSPMFLSGFASISHYRNLIPTSLPLHRRQTAGIFFWLVEFLDAAVCRSPWGKSVLQQLQGWRGSFGKCRAANIHFTCWIHIPSILAAICFPLIK